MSFRHNIDILFVHCSSTPFNDNENDCFILTYEIQNIFLTVTSANNTFIVKGITLKHNYDAVACNYLSRSYRLVWI